MISSKWSAGLFSILLMVVLLLPITENWKEAPKDDFPLSYYPMFSHRRAATHSLNYVIGYDQSMNWHYIPYRYIDSGGFNQVRRQLNKRVREDNYKGVLPKVARRLKRSDQAPYNKIITIELVRGRFRYADYFIKKDKKPLSEKILDTYLIDRSWEN